MKLKKENLMWKVLASLATIVLSGIFVIEVAGFQQKGASVRPTGTKKLLLVDGNAPPPQWPTQPPKTNA